MNIVAGRTVVLEDDSIRIDRENGFQRKLVHYIDVEEQEELIREM